MNANEIKKGISIQLQHAVYLTLKKLIKIRLLDDRKFSDSFTILIGVSKICVKYPFFLMPAHAKGPEFALYRKIYIKVHLG